MTTQRVFNLDGFECKRIIDLTKLKALTRTTQPANWKLVLHVNEEHDYYIYTEHREELVAILKN